MKKTFVYAICGALLLGSCGSYAGSGAFAGSQLGSILGSAIGGISDGPRGSDWGTLIGMAGGAVVGGAIGSAADRAQQQRIEQKREEIRARSQQNQYDYGTQQGSGYDPNNRGDDRIDLNLGGGGAPSAYGRTSGRQIEIRNVYFVENDRDNALAPGEIAKIVFEVYNHTSSTIYDVRPMVSEVSGNRQIYISPNARVEQIGPHKGIRYTAMVRGGRRLRNGTAVFSIQANQADGRAHSNVEEIRVRTRR